jgi:hypothetical protein
MNPNKVDVSTGIIPDNFGTFGDKKEVVCFCSQKKFLKKNTDIYIDPVHRNGWIRITWKIEEKVI